MKKNFSSLVVFLLGTLPSFAFAQTPTPSGGSGLQTGLNQIKDQFPSQSEIAKSQTVGDLIIAIIRILLGVLLAVTVLFIIIGGYQYVTSAGNESQAKKGRQTLIYAIIGLVLVVLSYVIVNVVTGSLDSSQI